MDSRARKRAGNRDGTLPLPLVPEDRENRHALARQSPQ